MSELRLVSHAEHSPGTCFRCTGHKGPFVDTGITHYDGQVYICEDCVAGIARTMGLPTVEELAELAILNEDRKEEIAQLKAAIGESRRTLASEFYEFVREHEGTEPAPEREPAEVTS